MKQVAAQTLLEAAPATGLRKAATRLGCQGARSKEELARRILRAAGCARRALEALTVTDLRNVCAAMGIQPGSRSKVELIDRLMQSLRLPSARSAKFSTPRGRLYEADCVEMLGGRMGGHLQGRVNLILTSPPFPLLRKKAYGNLAGDEYLQWFESLAPIFSRVLAPTGSLVIELGNSWIPERPVQSLLPLEALLAFVKHPDAGLRLCQQLAWHNPARLPSPAQWVTVKRVRLTDSFTHIWWMAKTDSPNADNRRVLRPYSRSMTSLIQRGEYNAGTRPSQHGISRNGFLQDHGGSIMPNVLPAGDGFQDEGERLPQAMLRFSNTVSNGSFQKRCRAAGLKPHPARMPLSLAAFFVALLTEPGDLVLDPFGGSNTTGYVAEQLGRRWISIEQNPDYCAQSVLRFAEPSMSTNGVRHNGTGKAH